MTSVSLLARAMVRPARIAPSVGTSPAAPTRAEHDDVRRHVRRESDQSLGAAEELRTWRGKLARETIDGGAVEQRHRLGPVRPHELGDQGDVGAAGREPAHPELLREGVRSLQRPATDRSGRPEHGDGLHVSGRLEFG